ncbi:hypothetical protein ASD50_12020 [Mesorhizobium sp. Root552]|uniref:hypothetical protein n=1 Tax=Mesorhizobium sp. Root552 TaxID=1736555 RepID=UPI0006F461F2|nr:hypothetical protein [Mesorhizobium sp. Root552]KQZ12467.1 hypothetical protein ASD50_12020 [Mesorhizobium sp. Root552]
MAKVLLSARWIVPALIALMFPAAASAQNGPCELDASGELSCYSNNNPNMLEASCLTYADPKYCLPYHQRACQVNGFALACRMANLGQNCAGGDPAGCNYYMQILQANRACNLEGNQQACSWIIQQGL